MFSGLRGGFDVFIDNKAVDAIHPDIESSGGLLETKRTAELCRSERYPGGYASCRVASGRLRGVSLRCNFHQLSGNGESCPRYALVAGFSQRREEPIIDHGYVAVPETPGLGIELNDQVVKAHLRRPGYFEPTPMFDDRIVSGYYVKGGWPHYTEDGKWCDNCESNR